MNLFVLLSKKIIFPEMDIAGDNNSYFDMYVSVFNHGTHDFIRSLYKFMIVHHYIANQTTNSPFHAVNIKTNENIQNRIDKYNFLKRNIENIFFQKEDKEQFLNYFCKIQKHYFAFSRLLNAWKHKRAQVTVSDDLYLNPLDANGKNIFVIVQNRKKYLFSIANLINMVNSALSNTSHFFASPLILKNPYNNGVFNKSDLYNLYFAIKQSTFIMPTLFHYYFLANFNITRFREQHEGVIREISIENYIKNTDSNALYDKVFAMLKEHKPRLAIHPDFPKEDLVNIMRPYLRLYYVSMYSLDEYKKLTAFSELHKKLHKFYRYNPKFGRKTIKRVCNSNFKFINKIVYDNKHINYYTPVSTEEFMRTHQECNDSDSADSSDDEYEATSMSESNTISNSIYDRNSESFRVLLFQAIVNTNADANGGTIANSVNADSSNNLDGETAYDSESDTSSDQSSGFEYIRRPRGEEIAIDDDETEYQQMLTNMMLADENQQPISQQYTNRIIDTEESDSESESDEIVIQEESDEDSEMDLDSDEDE